MIQMALIPYDPFRQLTNIRRDFDRLFNDFPFHLDNERNQLGNIRVDVHETEQEVVATCDIPGLQSKEDVNIDIENNVLRISGSNNRTNEIKEVNMQMRERYTGSFHRSIILRTTVSEDGITAYYKY